MSLPSRHDDVTDPMLSRRTALLYSLASLVALCLCIALGAGSGERAARIGDDEGVSAIVEPESDGTPPSA